MEQIGDCFQFERRQLCPSSSSTTITTSSIPDEQQISTVTFQSLDTVRALHQTVVSLRTALEEAHREIDTLKKQITISGDIEQGKRYREELNEFELIGTPLKSPAADKREIPFGKSSETVHTTRSEKSRKSFTGNDANNDLDESKRTYLNETVETDTSGTHFVGKHKIYENCQAKLVLKARATDAKINKADPESSSKFDKRFKQMASKIDVKIKLSSNFKVDGSGSGSSISDVTGDTNSGTVTPRDSTTDATNENEEKNVNVNVTTKETITVENTNQGISILRTSTENINVDDASLNLTTTEDEDDNDAACGGDDSVFIDEQVASTSKAALNSKEYADSLAIRNQSSPHRSSCDNQEEVDDIELIFSSDDKEYPQEDLVSISYYEPWHMCGQSGTPILVNFNRIASDNDGGGTDNSESREELSPSPIDPDQFYNAIKENVAQQQFILESSDSLSAGDNLKRSFEFYTKSSSLEKDSSDRKANDDDGIRRDESFDKFEQEGFASTFGRRWTNYNVFQETDISKVGIAEENVMDKDRRNTCPNPTAYRPIIHREALGRHTNNNTNASMLRCPLAVKFARNARNYLDANSGRSTRPMLLESSGAAGPKRSSSAQTDISALPEHWRSESNLATGLLGSGFFTLPSKFVPQPGSSFCKHPLKIWEKTREARRVLLSDINFTSMVPELSRSADHLCHGENQQNVENNNGSTSKYATGGNSGYYKGTLLKTPDYANRGITPSMSLTSPGVSQWTVNENSFGTQTTQTDNYWCVQHDDSFDSCKSYSIGSKISYGKHHRSRSCPSVRCALCKHHHHGGIKMSESMHYTPRVTFQETNTGASVRGSLPDLRPDCACGCPRLQVAGRHTALRYGDSCGSTESILDEADDFLRQSIDGVFLHDNFEPTPNAGNTVKATRRCSENDIKKDFSPSKHTLPFLPKSSKCLKPGHLAKVIAKNGRVVIGRVRYVGPLASTTATPTNKAAPGNTDSETYVGLQLPNKIGDCNGSFEGRKFFDCDPQHGIFVPFKKIVMAWTS